MANPSLSEWTPDRRRQAEWVLLLRMVNCNKDRLADPQAFDNTLSVSLRHTPALPLSALAGGTFDCTTILHTHRLELRYPRFFPAVPLELYLQQPVAHPNIHPETGFVCLWTEHVMTNNLEHALHKTCAILGWRLRNTETLHIMQPSALDLPPDQVETIRSMLAADPLLGLHHPHSLVCDSDVARGTSRRVRLS